MRLFRFALLLPLLLFEARADDYEDLRLFNEDETRSRLMMVDGNMYFVSGRGKNISFHINSVDSDIWFGQTNLGMIPNKH
ncbi:hypothetical protein QR680_005301 [Steinernema hermaphroditum]|uniref:Uncharacterized protein n=1 Tax=Steinernema hermaphroditum TaxID=289476 RepID=A0AA39HTQ2_9BILA|nr:hypothetical protein QR680_005301 [Steinernema hermaphroditum]